MTTAIPAVPGTTAIIFDPEEGFERVPVHGWERSADKGGWDPLIWFIGGVRPISQRGYGDEELKRGEPLLIGVGVGSSWLPTTFAVELVFTICIQEDPGMDSILADWSKFRGGA